MNPFRLALLLISALFFLQASESWAQFPGAGGGGRRGGQGGGQGGEQHQQPRQNQEQRDQKPQVSPVADPMAAVERELPSLRIDLKLDEKQSALFDRFERKVHEAAGSARSRMRHLSAFKLDDGSTVSATSIVATIATDDIERADAMRGAGDGLEDLYASLQPEQRRQLDRRIMMAMRDPLGNS